MLAEAVIPAPEVHQWPERPALPPCGQPVLVRVPTSTTRQAARLELRAALRALLAVWSDLSPELLPLLDTPQGPVWTSRLRGETLDISLSYAAQEGLIGLIRGGWVGVDVMPVEPFAGADEVARHYLGPAVAAALKHANSPAPAFAEAWTQREARLKCLKRGLTEWTADWARVEAGCACRNVLLGEHLMGAVAYRA